MNRSTKISVLILVIAILACTPGTNLPDNTDAGVSRRTGECTDPRFKEAELAAFQTLLQERDAATKAFEQQLTEIEKNYKERLLKQRTDYNNALNVCKDAACSAGAKADYDKYIAREQVDHEAKIEIAEDAEQTAIEQAQDRYNEAVDRARREFCTQAYKISSTHRWAGDNYTVTATMAETTLVADDQGKFAGHGTMTWVATLVPPEDCSIFTGSYEPSEVEMTGRKDESGQLTVEMIFQPVQYSGKEYCAIGNFVRSDDSWTVTETLQTLKFSVPAEGGTVPLSQELIGQRSSATGEAVIVVSPAEE